MIQYANPDKRTGARMKGRNVSARPISDFVMCKNLLIMYGRRVAAGIARNKTTARGEGSDDDAKKVTWQQGCCSSLQMVLVEMSRMQMVKRNENLKMR